MTILKTFLNRLLHMSTVCLSRWLACVALYGICLSATAQTQESRNGLIVAVPNGYANILREDLSVQSAIGSVAWTRRWDGQEWKFNSQWESLSQSWNNLTGSQTADTTASSFSSGSGASAGTQPLSTSNSGGAASGCWVWVDENWKPSSGTTLIGGATQSAVMDPARMTPFNRLMGESTVNYPPPQLVSVDYAKLCAGSGGALSSSGQVDTEGIRRSNELYLGDNGRYAFDNRSVLEKRSVRQLPSANAAALAAAMATGQLNLAPLTNPKGFRWIDKGGDYIDYNTQGQAVAYGDRNDNVIWMLRDTEGLVRGVIDGNGRVLFSLTYTGLLVTEIKDFPINGLSADLPARSVKYAYDANNRLIQVTDARGGVVKYDYDGANLITKITDPKTQTEQLTYTGNTVNKHVAPDGGVTNYFFEYDATNKQFGSKITGPETGAGRRSEDLTHNRVGKLIRRTVNGRIELEVRYDTGARAQIETGSRGFATRYVRNEFDQLTETAHPDNTARKASYSTAHLQMTEETDEAGFKTQYQHDNVGNLLKTVQAVGTPDERTTEYQRNAKGFPLKITRKGRTEVNGSITPDAVMQLEYDAQGEISKVTDPEGHARLYTYNRLGQLVRFVDTKGKATSMTYDADGNRLTETDPLNQVSTYTYDANANQASVTDARGKVYRFDYDAKDRLVKRSDPLSGEYVSSYNAYDQTTSVLDASGKGMRMEYDALVRLVKSVDTKAQVYEMGYLEADGQDKNYKRPSTVRYPTMSRVMRYNERDRLTLQSSIAGTETRVESFTYDGLSRRKTYTDPNGKTKYYVYNPHGEVVEVKDPLGNTMRMQRDTRGNVIQVTDPNSRTYGMRYDRRNLLVGSTDPLIASTTYSFDSNGWLSQINQANGQQVKYTYDDIGRIAQQQEFNAQSALQKTTNYSYDASGNLLTWNDGQYSATRTYDDNDRLSSETVSYSAAAGNASGFGLSHAYTYYGNGQIKTYTGPDGQTIGYQYDGAAQLEQVSIPGEGNIATTEWQWFQPKKVLLPGGSEQRMEYDGYQSLTRLKVVNPAQATLFELQNQYGKLAEVKQATTDGNALSYAYDDAGRLTQVSGSALSGRSESFGLDAGNNRISHNKTGSALWQYDNANQLTQRPAPGGNGTVNYQYDASGNQTVKTLSALAEPFRTTRFSYDALNRLSQVLDGAGQLIASYSYDPFDRRLRKTLGNSATLFTTLGSSGQAAGQVTSYLHTDWGILAEANSTGQIQVSYGYNPQRDNGVAPMYARVPAKDSAGNPTGDYRYTYYHNDHLGTPQRLTDKAGNLLWSAQYDAYGKAQMQTTASVQLATINPLRQPGQYLDLETGLHYNDRRYYEADTGRYASRDPIGFEGGINLYTYAEGNPINRVDPNGEVPVWILAGGAIGGAVGAYQKALDPCASKTDIFLAGLGGAIAGALSAAIPTGSASKFASGFISGAVVKSAAGSYGLNQVSNVISNAGFSGVAANHNAAVTSAMFGGFFGAVGNISGLGSALLKIRSKYPNKAVQTGDRISTAVGVLGGTLDSAAQFAASTSAVCECKR